MGRQEVLDILRAHFPEMQRSGVRRLAVFGSTARDEATRDSDVDVLVEFQGPATLNGFMDLTFRLEELLGKPVDLVTVAALKPAMRDAVLREAVDVS